MNRATRAAPSTLMIAIWAADTRAVRILVRLLARGLTPNRFWEAHDRDAVLEIVFGVWFGANEELEEVVLMHSDTFADREQVRFRFRGSNRDGPMVVEVPRRPQGVNGRLRQISVAGSAEFQKSFPNEYETAAAWVASAAAS